MEQQLNSTYLRPGMIERAAAMGIAAEPLTIKAVKVSDESPAQKAGMRANDIITHLNDKSVEQLSLNQAVEKMRGPPNSVIKLKLLRAGQDSPIELSITRGLIQSGVRQIQVQQ